jgi:hypothetical protein
MENINEYIYQVINNIRISILDVCPKNYIYLRLKDVNFRLK